MEGGTREEVGICVECMQQNGGYVFYSTPQV
jgi:hypothetical protein